MTIEHPENKFQKKYAVRSVEKPRAVRLKEKALSLLIAFVLLAIATYFMIHISIHVLASPWPGVVAAILVGIWSVLWIHGKYLDRMFMWLADLPGIILLAGAQRWREFIEVLGLFTRLPLPRGEAASALELKLAAAWHPGWAFPVVGFLIGIATASTILLCYFFSIPSSVGAVTALVVSVLLTGSRHEDGLSDFLDGIGGGKNREDALRIMKDGAIGAYGGLAMIFSLAARGVAIAEMPPVAAAGAVIAAHTISRGGLVLPLHWYYPIKKNSFTLSEKWPPPQIVALGLGITIFLTLAAQPDASTAMIGWIAGILAIIFTARFAQHKLGGYSNDVMSTCQQFSEIAVLWSIAAFLI